VRIRFSVNGKPRAYSGSGMKRLLDVLREDFGLPGTKEGCGEGECGACTVLLDGQAVVSCLVPVAQVAGRRVKTVESLGRPDRLGSLQEAFLAEGAAQCGICTPGMLMTATAYLQRGGRADDGAIRRELAGNLCRCTGYQHIVSAVQKAARRGRPAGRRRSAKARRGPVRRAGSRA
jgi:aerobic-type carbon monoxide dehydrogenase small subunit (CoxS/CutS family)